MKNRVVGACVALSLLLVAGCAAMKSPAPDQPGSGPKLSSAEIIALVGDAGLACAAAPIGLKPGDVVKAQVAVAAAASVLSSDQPSLTAIQRAFAVAGLPAQWQGVASVAVSRIRVHLGNTDLIPRDSVGFRAVASFLDTCSSTLGTGDDAVAGVTPVHATDRVGAVRGLAVVAEGRIDFGWMLRRVADPTLTTAADRIAARALARATAAAENAQSVDTLLAAYKAAAPLPAAARATARRVAYAAHVHRVDVLQQKLHARLVEIGPEPGGTMPKPGDKGVNFIRYPLAA